MKVRLLVALCFVAAISFGSTLGAQTAAVTGPAPAFADNGQLRRPADYREWIFLTSGLGMTYGPAQPAAGQPRFFDNVFVTRAAYRQFLSSGQWPEQTMFILEIRRGEADVSINNDGRTQGEVVAIEAAVKDRARFTDGGWGYFSFDGDNGPVDSAAPLPATASCYACHKANTAVDNTFVQFYPTLFEVARRLGTVRKDYDPQKKA